MMIAFSVFGILIAITVSSFKQSLELQQLSALLMEAHDTVGLVFEQISREVRTSDVETLTASGGTLSFTNQYGVPITYTFDNGSKSIQRDGTVITSENQNIEIRGFRVGLAPGTQGTEYKRLVMTVETVVTDRRGIEYPSVIQTSVSPRFYE
ncbi:hypothetical protein A2755_00905 [Candidatus Wolfebacteria bacterium RIFCSPHIGHO2_01_FULL_48_22]|uniref:Uncharacterized protein n=2 Tax=Candidatus Wolfeibacteriota TaxID=1752735 RepID=A0A1F8DU23_9BACT|nr:MAG: hypothetical protein A2755_00905 [Candidatus Wolfebacteria bacterium RIFCSPHIGHO2_01_FULL_48_22]OGM93571.1 MAG: hypothetical protein A2935_03020 [Candidatus Wolfebacteria bacterium RIFCSPLOWO2_01_FULL_47_17b]